jgi:hypothetical protein
MVYGLCAPAVGGTLAFGNGGFNADMRALAALALAWVLVVACIFKRAAAPIDRRLFIAAIGFGGLASWTLLSATWVAQWGLALTEAARVGLVLLALLCGALYGRLLRPGNVMGMLLLAVVSVAALALFARFFPEVLDRSTERGNNRLAWPLGYWNTLGAWCAAGFPVALRLAADSANRAVLRGVAAASVPVLGIAEYLTFSRGGLVCTGIGLCTWLVLSGDRIRHLWWTALLGAVTVGMVVRVESFDALVAYQPPPLDIAARQGREFAGEMILVSVALVCVPWLGSALSIGPLRSLMTWAASRRHSLARIVMVVGVVGGIVGVAGWTALEGGPATLADGAWKSFRSDLTPGDDNNDRLLSISSTGRVSVWRIAAEIGWERFPIGAGAASFSQDYRERRHTDLVVNDAHSILLENWAELGVPGVLFMTAGIGGLLAACLASRRVRSPAAAAVGAGFLALAIHSAVDFDWEVTSIWVLWVGAVSAVATNPADRKRAVPPRPAVRVAVIVAALTVAAISVPTGLSEARLLDSRARIVERDFGGAITAAKRARAVLGGQAAPFELETLALLGDHRFSEAVGIARSGIARYPENSRLWILYSQALVATGAFEEARAAALEALRRDPRDPTAKRLTLREER